MNTGPLNQTSTHKADAFRQRLGTMRGTPQTEDLDLFQNINVNYKPTLPEPRATQSAPASSAALVASFDFRRQLLILKSKLSIYGNNPRMLLASNDVKQVFDMFLHHNDDLSQRYFEKDPVTRDKLIALRNTIEEFLHQDWLDGFPFLGSHTNAQHILADYLWENPPLYEVIEVFKFIFADQYQVWQQSQAQHRLELPTHQLPETQTTIPDAPDAQAFTPPFIQPELFLPQLPLAQQPQARPQPVEKDIAVPGRETPGGSKAASVPPVRLPGQPAVRQPSQPLSQGAIWKSNANILLSSSRESVLESQTLPSRDAIEAAEAKGPSLIPVGLFGKLEIRENNMWLDESMEERQGGFSGQLITTHGNLYYIQSPAHLGQALQFNTGITKFNLKELQEKKGIYLLKSDRNQQLRFIPEKTLVPGLKTVVTLATTEQDTDDALPFLGHENTRSYYMIISEPITGGKPFGPLPAVIEMKPYYSKESVVNDDYMAPSAYRLTFENMQTAHMRMVHTPEIDQRIQCLASQAAQNKSLLYLLQVLKGKFLFHESLHGEDWYYTCIFKKSDKMLQTTDYFVVGMHVLKDNQGTPYLFHWNNTHDYWETARWEQDDVFVPEAMLQSFLSQLPLYLDSSPVAALFNQVNPFKNHTAPSEIPIPRFRDPQWQQLQSQCDRLNDLLWYLNQVSLYQKPSSELLAFFSDPAEKKLFERHSSLKQKFEQYCQFTEKGAEEKLIFYIDSFWETYFMVVFQELNWPLSMTITKRRRQSDKILAYHGWPRFVYQVYETNSNAGDRLLWVLKKDLQRKEKSTKNKKKTTELELPAEEIWSVFDVLVWQAETLPSGQNTGLLHRNRPIPFLGIDLSPELESLMQKVWHHLIPFTI